MAFKNSWGYSDELLKTRQRSAAKIAGPTGPNLSGTNIAKTPQNTNPIPAPGYFPSSPMVLPDQWPAGLIVNATREQCDMFDRLGVIPCERSEGLSFIDPDERCYYSLADIIEALMGDDN